jgi:hypothetical protein
LGSNFSQARARGLYQFSDKSIVLEKIIKILISSSSSDAS